MSQAIRVYNLHLTALHWDLTSIYCEGANSDSQLVNYGYSWDQRPDTKQINLEVDASHDGLMPIPYRVLTGNTADITRPLPHLTALLRFLARPELAERHLRPLLISHCKMITTEAVLAYHRHGLYYLGPLQDSTAVMTVLRSVPAPELAGHSLAYRPQRRTLSIDDGPGSIWQDHSMSYTRCWRSRQQGSRPPLEPCSRRKSCSRWAVLVSVRTNTPRIAMIGGSVVKVQLLYKHHRPGLTLLLPTADIMPVVPAETG